MILESLDYRFGPQASSSQFPHSLFINVRILLMNIKSCLNFFLSILLIFYQKKKDKNVAGYWRGPDEVSIAILQKI